MVVEASVEQRPITRRTMKTTCSSAKVLTAVTAMMLAGSSAGCDAAANAFEIIEAAPGVAAEAPIPAGDAPKALVQLESIPVKGRAPKTGYTRDKVGAAWADTDRNGCDTRNDIPSSDVQIDHIVALSDAWQKGAQQLNADQRKEFANDPLNLMAADGPTNGAKGN